MKTYHLTVATPSGKSFDGDVLCFSARGVLGSFAVMAGHVPFTTSVKEGEIKITLDDESEKTYETDDGIFSVSKDGAVLLTTACREK